MSSVYGYNRAVKIAYDPGDVIETEIFQDPVIPGQPIASGFVLLNVYVHGHYVNIP